MMIKYLSPVIFLVLFLVGCDQDKKKDDAQRSEARTKELAEEATALAEKGRSLFMDSCEKCHAIGRTDNYFLGVVQKEGAARLKLFLTRQDSLIAAKDSAALELKENYGHLGNSHNFHYSDAELNALIVFMATYWK